MHEPPRQQQHQRRALNGGFMHDADSQPVQLLTTIGSNGANPPSDRPQVAAPSGGGEHGTGAHARSRADVNNAADLGRVERQPSGFARLMRRMAPSKSGSGSASRPNSGGPWVPPSRDALGDSSIPNQGQQQQAATRRALGGASGRLWGACLAPRTRHDEGSLHRSTLDARASSTVGEVGRSSDLVLAALPAARDSSLLLSTGLGGAHTPAGTNPTQNPSRRVSPTGNSRSGSALASPVRAGPGAFGSDGVSSGGGVGGVAADARCSGSGASGGTDQGRPVRVKKGSIKQLRASLERNLQGRGNRNGSGSGGVLAGATAAHLDTTMMSSADIRQRDSFESDWDVMGPDEGAVLSVAGNAAFASSVVTSGDNTASGQRPHGAMLGVVAAALAVSGGGGGGSGGASGEAGGRQQSKLRHGTTDAGPMTLVPNARSPGLTAAEGGSDPQRRLKPEAEAGTGAGRSTGPAAAAGAAGAEANVRAASASGAAVPGAQRNGGTSAHAGSLPADSAAPGQTGGQQTGGTAPMGVGPGAEQRELNGGGGGGGDADVPADLSFGPDLHSNGKPRRVLERDGSDTSPDAASGGNGATAAAPAKPRPPAPEDSLAAQMMALQNQINALSDEDLLNPSAKLGLLSPGHMQPPPQQQHLQQQQSAPLRSHAQQRPSHSTGPMPYHTLSTGAMDMGLTGYGSHSQYLHPPPPASPPAVPMSPLDALSAFLGSSQSRAASLYDGGGGVLLTSGAAAGGWARAVTSSPGGGGLAAAGSGRLGASGPSAAMRSMGSIHEEVAEAEEDAAASLQAGYGSSARRSAGAPGASNSSFLSVRRAVSGEAVDPAAMLLTREEDAAGRGPSSRGGYPAMLRTGDSEMAPAGREDSGRAGMVPAVLFSTAGSSISERHVHGGPHHPHTLTHTAAAALQQHPGSGSRAASGAAGAGAPGVTRRASGLSAASGRQDDLPGAPAAASGPSSGSPLPPVNVSRAEGAGGRFTLLGALSRFQEELQQTIVPPPHGNGPGAAPAAIGQGAAPGQATSGGQPLAVAPGWLAPPQGPWSYGGQGAAGGGGGGLGGGGYSAAAAALGRVGGGGGGALGPLISDRGVGAAGFAANLGSSNGAVPPARRVGSMAAPQTHGSVHPWAGGPQFLAPQDGPDVSGVMQQLMSSSTLGGQHAVGMHPPPSPPPHMQPHAAMQQQQQQQQQQQHLHQLQHMHHMQQVQHMQQMQHMQHHQMMYAQAAAGGAGVGLQAPPRGTRSSTEAGGNGRRSTDLLYEELFSNGPLHHDMLQQQHYHQMMQQQQHQQMLQHQQHLHHHQQQQQQHMQQQQHQQMQMQAAAAANAAASALPVLPPPPALGPPPVHSRSVRRNVSAESLRVQAMTASQRSASGRSTAAGAGAGAAGGAGRWQTAQGPPPAGGTLHAYMELEEDAAAAAQAEGAAGQGPAAGAGAARLPPAGLSSSGATQSTQGLGGASLPPSLSGGVSSGLGSSNGRAGAEGAPTLRGPLLDQAGLQAAAAALPMPVPDPALPHRPPPQSLLTASSSGGGTGLSSGLFDGLQYGGGGSTAADAVVAGLMESVLRSGAAAALMEDSAGSGAHAGLTTGASHSGGAALAHAGTQGQDRAAAQAQAQGLAILASGGGRPQSVTRPGSFSRPSSVASAGPGAASSRAAPGLSGARPPSIGQPPPGPGAEAGRPASMGVRQGAAGQGRGAGPGGGGGSRSLDAYLAYCDEGAPQPAAAPRAQQPQQQQPPHSPRQQQPEPNEQHPSQQPSRRRQQRSEESALGAADAGGRAGEEWEPAAAAAAADPLAPHVPGGGELYGAPLLRPAYGPCEVVLLCAGAAVLLLNAAIVVYVLLTMQSVAHWQGQAGGAAGGGGAGEL